MTRHFLCHASIKNQPKARWLQQKRWLNLIHKNQAFSNEKLVRLVQDGFNNKIHHHKNIEKHFKPLSKHYCQVQFVKSHYNYGLCFAVVTLGHEIGFMFISEKERHSDRNFESAAPNRSFRNI